MVAVAVRRLGGALHAGRQLPNLRAEPSDLLRRLGDVAGVELDPRFAHRPGDAVAVPVAAGGEGDSTGSGQGRAAGEKRDLRPACRIASLARRPAHDLSGVLGLVLDDVADGLD